MPFPLHGGLPLPAHDDSAGAAWVLGSEACGGAAQSAHRPGEADALTTRRFEPAAMLAVLR